MEVKFPDGSLIHQDPRLEDTLFYYYPKGDPRLAVGMRMEFDPHAAHPAWTYRFREDHLTRLRSMSDPDLALMTQRYAQTIHEEGHGNMKAFARASVIWRLRFGRKFASRKSLSDLIRNPTPVRDCCPWM
jgi:hypothetical protein